MGPSPRQSSQFLQKALDKVLKRVGGKEKSATLRCSNKYMKMVSPNL